MHISYNHAMAGKKSDPVSRSGAAACCYMRPRVFCAPGDSERERGGERKGKPSARVHVHTYHYGNASEVLHARSIPVVFHYLRTR